MANPNGQSVSFQEAIKQHLGTNYGYQGVPREPGLTEEERIALAEAERIIAEQNAAYSGMYDPRRLNQIPAPMGIEPSPVQTSPAEANLPIAGPPAPIDPMGTGYAGPRTPPGIGNNIPNLGLNLNEAGGPDLSGMQSLIGTLMEQMNMEQPGMPMQDAGTQANPLASMAAVFSASMADSLTGRRGQTMNVQRQLAQHEQNRRRIEKENRVTEEENFRQQQMFRIDKLNKISEIEYQMAEEMLDYTKMQQILKNDMTRATHLDRLKKETQQAYLEQQGENMTRTSPGKSTMTPAQESSARKRALDENKEVWDDENIYDTKGEHGDTIFGWTGIGEVAHRGNMLPEFFEKYRQMATAQALDSPSHSGGITGLHRYILTLHQFRNSDGTFKDMQDPPSEVRRFFQIGVSVFGDRPSFTQWLLEQGYISPEQAR